MTLRTGHILGSCLIVLSLLLLPSANAGDREVTQSDSCIDKKRQDSPFLTREQASTACTKSQTELPLKRTTPCPAGMAGSCSPGVGRNTDEFIDSPFRIDSQRPSLNLQDLRGIDRQSTQ